MSVPNSGSLRVAIIGVGFGEAVLAPAFALEPRARVVGFCARDPARAEAAAGRAAARSGEAVRAWRRWAEVVGSAEVDAVAIAVPPALQPEIVRAALGAGKHVFAEKPLGVSAASTRDLPALAQHAGVAHAVDFEMAELASFRRAREIVRGESDAARAPWGHFLLSWQVETRANRLGAHPWKNARDLGGGALLGFGSHVVHAVEHLLGPVTRVAARLWPSEASVADRRVDVLVELEGGASGVISVATDAACGAGFRLEAYGADRALLLENRTMDHLRNFVLSVRRRGDAHAEVLVDERVEVVAGETLPDGRVAPVASLARRFVDAALGGAPVEPSLAHGARVDVVLDAIRASHEGGGWQEVA